MKKDDATRRDFLKLAGTSAPLAAAAVAVGAPAQAEEVDPTSERMQDTVHTRAFYETARFYTLDEHTAVPDVLLIATRSWARLGPEERRALERQLGADRNGAGRG